MAKAYLSSFKFEHIVQDIKEGEGSGLVDGEGVEIAVNVYKLENGTIQAGDVKLWIFYFCIFNKNFLFLSLVKANQSNLKLVNSKMAK